MYESFVPKHLTDPLWERLSNARVFVTGGTGLFGHWILDTLTDANRRLNLKIDATVLTRNPEVAKIKMPGLDQRIRFIKGHVESFEIPKEKFDFILHMATTSAEETFQGAAQSHKLKLLYDGTQRILELAQKSGAKRILFTSSGAVYGSQVCDRIKEIELIHVDPLKASSGLALGKGVAEFLLKQSCSDSNLEVVIARCFSFVGPGLPLGLHYAIGNFIKNSLDESPIIIKGDGNAIRSYMYMGDLVWWLLKLLLDGQSGEAYNVGSDESVSIFDLAQLVKRISNSKSEIIIMGDSAYSLGVPVHNIYLPCITKASSKLQLKINEDLFSSISNTYNFENL